MPQRQVLAGSLEEYEDFIQKGFNASVLKASSDFAFQITTTEAPQLVVREVHTTGSASNHYEWGDAFFGLMLSHPPGWFSSSNSRHPEPVQASEHHSLHWHFPDGLTNSHHLNSHVTYVRLESSQFLRALAASHLCIDQLQLLQGAWAQEPTIALISGLSQKLLQSPDCSSQTAICEQFLETLVEQLASMVPDTSRQQPTAAAHVAASIEILSSRHHQNLSLAELARELNLTTRAVQASFQARLQCSPMRWLKLYRLSQLRQLLMNPVHQGLSIQQLMQQCGLPSSGLSSQSYRSVYGRTPIVERTVALSRPVIRNSSESVQFQFRSPQEAIRKLEELQWQWSQPNSPKATALSITLEVTLTS
ncbi:MAG: helix-turn-helix domain-containing protein [Cyanobacteriota bacterium]